MNKRILSLLLTLLMLVSLMPMAAFAEEAEVITEIIADEIIGEMPGETMPPLEGDSGEATYGTCGTNVTWNLEDGVLTISGGGAMADYTAADPAPWYSYSASITTVLIESGVENIGAYAFAGCSALTLVSIPLSVESIGDYAFSGCSLLVNVSYDGTRTQWDALTSGITKGSGNEVLVEANVQCAEDSEFKAVTGEAKIDGSDVTLYATFSKPATEDEYYLCFAYGISSEGLSNGDVYGKIGDNETAQWDDASDNVVLSQVYLLVPGVTYYYRAEIEEGTTGEVCAYGETEHFTAPSRTFDTISTDEGKTLAGYDAGHYCFTSVDGGTYSLSLSGEGHVCIYNGDGELAAQVETEGNFTAEAGAIYYIEAHNHCEDAIRLTLSKSGTSGGENPTSGTCGENLTWKLKDGTLTVSGTGKMTDYSNVNSVPWYSYCDTITSVVIESGVTTIGQTAFGGCGLKSITIPSSVTSIEKNAFLMCEELESVVLGSGVIKIGDYAFAHCKALKGVTIPVSVTTIGAHAFENCAVLKDVYYCGTEAQWSDITIGIANTSLTGATIHIATAAEKVADALNDIAADATPDEIRAAVQGIGTETLKDALNDKSNTAVVQKLVALETKVGGSADVVVADGAGISAASIIGAKFNDVTGDVKLTISAASEETTLPDTVDSSKAVYLQMELDGVENPSDLKVPVCITIEVPAGIQWELVRLVHHTADGNEVLVPASTYVKDDVRYARFVIGGFSPFTLTEMAHKAGNVDGKEGVNILDVLALLKYVAGIDSTIVYGDVNNSGGVDILDVLTLLKYVAGIEGTVVY